MKYETIAIPELIVLEGDAMNTLTHLTANPVMHGDFTNVMGLVGNPLLTPLAATL
jgi:hypothetical protein